MNGNNPYAGMPSVAPAGRPDIGAVADLSPDRRRAIRDDLSRVAARTREYLPDEYVVGSEISSGADGLQATVAVQPPIGYAVSAGFTPEFDSEDENPLDEEHRNEVARGLAASAALQVKQAIGDDVTPTGR